MKIDIDWHLWVDIPPELKDEPSVADYFLCGCKNDGMSGVTLIKKEVTCKDCLFLLSI